MLDSHGVRMMAAPRLLWLAWLAAAAAIAPDEPFPMHTPHGTIEVPPIPADASLFAAASERAFVALPRACAAALGLAPNFADKDGAVELWFARRGELGGAREAALASARACGGASWVLLAHGSGGLTSKNYRFVARLAALGYGVFAPDSMALPRALALRHRGGVAPLAPVVAALTDANHSYDSPGRARGGRGGAGGRR